MYLFFGDRYIREEAQYAAVHDFLSAVITYAKEHRVRFLAFGIVPSKPQEEGINISDQ